MDLITKIIKENNEPYLIVAPENVKLNILENISKEIKDTTFISLKALLDNITFSFQDKAVYEVMTSFDLRYDVALSYLENMRNTLLINGDLLSFESEKVNKVREIYNLLESKNLLIRNPLYKEYLKTKKIIIYGYDELLKEEEYFLKGYDYQFIPKEDKTCKDSKKVFLCKNIEKELHFAFDKISSLIASGVNINKIKMIAPDNEMSKVKKFSSFYHLPVNLNDKISLHDYQYARECIAEYFNEGTIKAQDDIAKMNIYNEVVSFLNSIDLDLSSLDKYKKDIIISKMKNKYLYKERYDNAIEVISFDDLQIYSDFYVFILSFNQDKIVKMYKDDEYYKDSLKKRFSLSTSSEKNTSLLNNLKNLLKNENIFLSYSKYENGEELYPFSLIEDENMEIINFDEEYSKYSDDYNKYLLIRYKDDFFKYKKHDEIVASMVKTYNEEYKTYDNSYLPINKDEFKAYIDNTIRLSYSSIDNYNKCQFKYYINNVLKIDFFEETFPLFIGNMYHYILSFAFLNGFDFDKTYQDFLENKNKYVFKEGEEYLVQKLKEELKNVIEMIKTQYDYINYKDALYEEKVNIEGEKIIGGEKVKTIFTGIIDKLLYKEINTSEGKKVLISIIDYKTGIVDIKLDLIEYGLSLQLPVYLYLAKNMKNFDNVVFKGFFLQNILNKEPILSINEGIDKYNEKKFDDLKLKGYVVYDDNEPFDLSENNSLVIKGLKKKKDGQFYATSKVLSTSEVEEIINKTVSIIDKAYVNIYNANFNINPKVIKKKNESCMFCKYQDLCYKEPKDVVFIECDQEEGEENA